MRTRFEHLRNNPHLQHAKLSRQEMGMIVDVCNPGFRHVPKLHGENLTPSMLSAHIRANVEDSFLLYPGMYEEKWGLEREAFCRKLWVMQDDEFVQLARQVDAFWRQAVNNE